MLIYLLKSGACLAIFMAFYKFFLEKENMHVFKRYYLLGGLIVSFVIPLITFTQYIEVAPLPVVNEPLESVVFYSEAIPQVEETNYLPFILWSICGLGIMLFGSKFLMNLIQIIFKIKRNPRQKSKHFIHVLLNDLVTPHTFFSYIFLNKHKFEQHEIPQEVFWHEETHAKQKHSIDVLFVELLQVIFWFNPLIYFAKQAIKMNHEFLADQAVLNKGIKASNYQHILLAFSSNATEPQLANAINYSSIKKRFTVMKTNTSKRNIWLRSVLLLPLIALTLYGFSEKKEVIRELAENNHTSKSHSKHLIIMAQINGVLINGKPSSLETFKDNLNAETKNWDNADFNSAILDLKVASCTEEFLEKLDVEFRKTDYFLKSTQGVTFVSQKNTSSQEEKIPVLEISYNPEIFNLNGKKTSLSKLKEDFAKVTENKKSDLRIKTSETLKTSLIDNIGKELQGNLISILFGDSVSIFDDTSSGPKQQKATPEEVIEYNQLASQLNDKPAGQRIIKQKDFERMKYLYNKMSKEQKSSAEPFPNFPPPPPPPAPPTPKIYQGQIQLYILMNEKGQLLINDDLGTMGILETKFKKLAADRDKPQVVSFKFEKEAPSKDVNHILNLIKKYDLKDFTGTLESVPPPPPPPAKSNGNKQNPKEEKVVIGYGVKTETSSQYENSNSNEPITVKGYGTKNISSDVPSPPPPPKSPLDFVVEMAKENAKFFYESKEISSDEAIAIVKKQPKMNINAQKSNTEQKLIYLSKEPIIIGKQNKSEEFVMINGKKTNAYKLTLSRAELLDAKLTLKNGDITSFKFKIPGKPTQTIKGNQIDAEAKALINETLDQDTVQIFIIKDSENQVHPPIMIMIKD